MKRKTLYLILCGEAALLLALSFFASRMPDAFVAAAAFPFEQIGLGLRALSLSGRVGNGAAMLLWAAISLVPFAYALKWRGCAERKWENAALYALSVGLFAVLYCMVNPAAATPKLPLAGKDMLRALKAALGCAAVWSIAVCYGVLRLLRLFRAGDTAKLLQYLRSMLMALCALFVGCIAYVCAAELISALGAAETGADRAFAALRFLKDSLPYAMDTAVTLAAMTLIEKLLAGDGAAAVAAAEKLSHLCCAALALITAAGVALNCLQMLFMSGLTQVNAAVELPLMSLAFVLCALLLARLIRENKRLSDDNDLFI